MLAVFIFVSFVILLSLDDTPDWPCVITSAVLSLFMSIIISLILVDGFGFGTIETEVSYQHELVPMSTKSKELILTENGESYDVSFTYCDSFGIYRSINEPANTVDMHFVDDDGGYAVIYKTTETVIPAMGILTWPAHKPNESWVNYEYEIYVNPANIIKEEEIR